MQKTQLNAYETELLPQALEYARKLNETENRLPTQDEYRENLHCARISAKNISHYILETDAVKIAGRLETIPERAEVRNEVKNVLSEEQNSGSAYGYAVRKLALARAEIARLKFERDTQTEARKEIITADLEQLKTIAKENSPLPSVTYPPKPKTGNLLEINIPDAHLGKLAWSLETGYESYDTKIAEEMYRRAQSTLLDRSRHYDYDKIVIVMGNDILQSDNMLSQTTRGTFVSTDGRYHKTFYKACKMLIDCIEQARKVAPVHVVTMPGNHDRLAAWHLGHALECYFYRYNDITFDNDPTARKYVEWGVNMLMFTHGDTGDKTDYPLLMAAEQSAMFGRTKFREVHCGHTHETKTLEKHGVRVRVLPALCPPDEWHAANGFVGNQRNAEAYIYNDKEGLIGTVIYTDQSQEPLITKREFTKD